VKQYFTAKSTIAIFFALIIISSSCVKAKAPMLPHSNQQKSNLTSGMVKKYVKVGTATQNEILKVFGAPNIITRDRNGNEVWTYDKQSMASSSEIAAWNAGGKGAAMAGGLAGDAVVGGGGVLGGSAGKSSSAGQVSSTTFTLMVSFDENEKVIDYRMRATQF
jgi:hypothetical protein